MALTRKQRQLTKEIEELIQLFGLDYQNIGNHEAAARTPVLKTIKDQIVRGQIIMRYTLLDEMLNTKIIRLFFPGRTPFPQLWRTKRFRLFNHYIIERLTLLEKASLVKEIKKIPRGGDSGH